MNEQTYNHLVALASSAVLSDYDTRACSYELMEAFKSLLRFCELGTGDKPMYYDGFYNMDRGISDLILEEYIGFNSVGGSIADYAASAIARTLDSEGIYLTVADTEGFKNVMMPALDRALDPSREIGRFVSAGIF